MIRTGIILGILLASSPAVFCGLTDGPDPTSDGEYIATPLECRARGGEWIVTDGSGVCVIDDPEPVGVTAVSIHGVPVAAGIWTTHSAFPARVTLDEHWRETVEIGWIQALQPSSIVLETDDEAVSLLGTCDSTKECKEQAEKLCQDNGHGEVKDATVSITDHGDGSKTCSADCEKNGAVAFVTCKNTPKPSIALPGGA